MTPNPILKVLSTLTSCRVTYLLIGGQACVLYGAAEFSRDTDVVVLAERENLQRLTQGLTDLQAECIAVPPFAAEYLLRGHAIHFRCQHPDAVGLRIDVMSVLRGVAPFAELWQRRATIELESGQSIELMSLPDLVQAKKTQRDKDWPMIRRLVEAHFAESRNNPNPDQVMFWLKEARTIPILLELAQGYPEFLDNAVSHRPLLSFAKSGDQPALAHALELEEKHEREADRQYWLPLRQELEELRHRTADLGE